VSHSRCVESVALQLSRINRQPLYTADDNFAEMKFSIEQRVFIVENPHVIQQVPLHSEKVGVWCAVSPRRITGPVFFTKP
jgi:hypothetical protein